MVKMLATLILVVFTVGMVLANPLFGPFQRPETHPDLTNRERWLDFLSANPLGRLYHLHKDMGSHGLNLRDFDLVQPPLVLDEIRN